MNFLRVLPRTIARFVEGKRNVDQNLEFADAANNELRFIREKREENFIDIEIPKKNQPEELLDIDNFEHLTIETTGSILDSLNNLSFKTSNEDTEKVTIITFKNVNFESSLSSDELELLNSKFLKSSVVIFVESENNDKFLIYWKSSSIDNLLSFKAYNSSEMEDNKTLLLFIVKFLANSLERKHLGLCKSLCTNCDSKEFELHFLSDHREFNVLLVAAESGDIDVVSILLKMGFETESPFKNINAQSLAYDGQHFDILLLLLKSNLRYPATIVASECSEELQHFIKISDILHESVMANNIDDVKDIVATNSTLRYFYNTSNESAAAIALKHKFIDIYEFLMTNGVYFGPHENTEAIMEDLDYDTQRAVRELHFKHSKDLPENHINVLMANSFIGHDVPNIQEKLSLVQHAFTTLNSNAFIRIILMVVAASLKFRIIFDFNRDNVHVVDPTSSAYTNGIFYVSGRIYIGARQLLNKLTENETLGTLAHELCHYALNLTFRNDAKPYSKEDQLLMQKFEDICRKCEGKEDNDETVSLVYECYPQEMYHAELAVRVAHLMALNHGKPEKLQQSRENYKELFDFVEQQVGPEMEQAIPNIGAQFDREIEKKDKKISKLKRNLFISIVLGILSVVAVIIIAIVLRSPSDMFKDLNPDDQMKVKNANVMYRNVKVRMSDLYPENSPVYDLLTPDQIDKLLRGKKFNLDDPQLHHIHNHIQFKWGTLADNLKSLVFASTLNYQGQNVNYSTLNETAPLAFPALSSTQIKEILNKTELKIGQKIDSSVDFYIERKFYPEDTNMIDFEYKYGRNYEYNIFTREEHAKNRTMNITMEQFYTNFTKLSFEDQTEVFDSILRNYHFKSKTIDPNQENYRFLHKNLSQIIEKSENDKILILSSEAGAGKTVSFERLAISMKSKFPTRWVSYIDMKDYTRFYNKSGDVEDVDELLRNILELKSDKNNFEKVIFEESFKNNNSVFFWNGFDEISPTYNSFILNTIKKIKKSTKNIQFVCTRPLYSRQLRDAFKLQTWDLVPLDETGKLEFFTKYFKSQNMTAENITKNIKKAKNTIDKFESVNNLSYNFSTPVMLRLVSEIYDNQNSIESPGLYEIYETFVQKKIGIWLTKSKLERKILQKFISKFSVIEIYQKYALLNELRIFGTTTFAIKFKKLKIMQIIVPKDLPYEEISRMGILYINGENKFEFAHRTFAEFFIAKYLIENLYLVDNYVDKDEIELRLELFFLLARNYKDNQEIVTNFMDSYFQIADRDEDGEFCDKFKELVRDKFINSFVRLLDTNYPKIYEFLFKFFNREKDLLLDLLRINEDETFFTAIFNPNYIAISTNPDEILALARIYLNDTEIDKFIHGRHQKGTIMYGMYFYQQLGVNKSHSTYNNDLTSLNVTKFWDFHEKINETLEIEEIKEFAVTALSPKIFLFYNSTFNETDFLEFEKQWESYEVWLSNDDIYVILKTALINYFELFPYKNKDYLQLLINKFVYFENYQIYEFYVDSNILQKAHWDSVQFSHMWDILASFTNEEQKREFLLRNFTDDRNFYFYHSIKEPKNQFSNRTYVYLYYDFSQFTLLHRSLTTPYLLTFNNVSKIYNSSFTNSEIQDIILSSNDLLYYVIEEANEESCMKFAEYLKELFKDNPKALRKFFERKIKPTNLNIFTVIESFKDLAGSEKRWNKNLGILRNLYKDLK